MRQGRSAVASPVPVGPLIERQGQVADLGFRRSVAIEIRGHRQRACEQEGRIDRRQLALPDPAAGLDIQEMIEEAFVA